jgi:RimJ/RimL family protein N-acetyltransferase
MKSLLFIVKEFCPDAYKDLEKELREKETELKSFVYTGFDIENILGRLTKEIKESGKDTLLVTDSPEIYDYIRVLGHDAVALAEKKEDFSLYPDAKYIVMKPYEIEALYYERVWMRFNNIPWTIAVTDRLIIRETIESDVDDFYRIYKDSRMTRYTEKLYENIEEERKYIAEYREKVYAVQGFGIWTVLKKDDGRIIGRAGLITRGGFDDVEVGYAIDTAFQHMGFAKEAVTECIEIAQDLGFSRVYALTDKENEPSLALLRSLSFKYEKDCVVDGRNLVKMTLNKHSHVMR